MSEKFTSTSFKESYAILKEAADWLSKPGEADIDLLVPKVANAMEAFKDCKDRIATVRESLNRYFVDDQAGAAPPTRTGDVDSDDIPY
jgi:exodeoxyribonuclease VII small subunit